MLTIEQLYAHTKEYLTLYQIPHEEVRGKSTLEKLRRKIYPYLGNHARVLFAFKHKYNPVYLIGGSASRNYHEIHMLNLCDKQDIRHCWFFIFSRRDIICTVFLLDLWGKMPFLGTRSQPRDFFVEFLDYYKQGRKGFIPSLLYKWLVVYQNWNEIARYLLFSGDRLCISTAGAWHAVVDAIHREILYHSL